MFLHPPNAPPGAARGLRKLLKAGIAVVTGHAPEMAQNSDGRLFRQFGMNDVFAALSLGDGGAFAWGHARQGVPRLLRISSGVDELKTQR